MTWAVGLSFRVSAVVCAVTRAPNENRRSFGRGAVSGLSLSLKEGIETSPHAKAPLIGLLRRGGLFHSNLMHEAARREQAPYGTFASNRPR